MQKPRFARGLAELGKRGRNRRIEAQNRGLEPVNDVEPYIVPFG